MTTIIVILSVLVVFFLLIRLKITIEYKLSVINYKINVSADIRLFGRRIIINKKSKEKSEKTVNKTKQKAGTFKLNDIMIFKQNVSIILNKIFGLMRRVLFIDYFETEIMLALPDPFSNGIAYGAASGFLNIFYMGLLEIFQVKEYFLDINSDFDSGEGLILKNRSKLSIRPGEVACKFIYLCIFDKEFRKVLAEISKIFKEE